MKENIVPGIPASDEAWEDKTLGADTKYVGIEDPSAEAAIDEAAGTQLISIRMQKTLIEDLKMIASLNNGIGYQTLMKQVLQRFVESEKKQMLREYVTAKLEEKQNAENAETPAKPRRKAA